jgi:predicted DNA-binding protein (MmcQ/YjbR family)
MYKPRTGVGSAGVTPDELRSTCLTLAGAVEERPFPDPAVVTFKVGGKIFAITRFEGTVSLKCDPDLAEQLRHTYPEIRPGYHLNKRHWNTIALDGSLADDMVRDLIEDSYALIVAALPRLRRPRAG